MLPQKILVAVAVTILAWKEALCDPGHRVGCATLFDVDFPSETGILNDGKNDRTSSNADCCLKCSRHPACKVWTRVKSSVGPSTEGECWLRSFRPELKGCSYCDSGLNSCGVLGNTDLPSKDGILNDGKKTITGDNATCCLLCNQRSGELSRSCTLKFIVCESTSVRNCAAYH